MLGRKEGSLSRQRRLEALSNTTGGSCSLEVPCLGWPTCPWTWRVPARPPVNGVGEMSEYPTRRMVHSQPAGGGVGSTPGGQSCPNADALLFGKLLSRERGSSHSRSGFLNSDHLHPGRGQTGHVQSRTFCTPYSPEFTPTRVSLASPAGSQLPVWSQAELESSDALVPSGREG